MRSLRPREANFDICKAASEETGEACYSVLKRLSAASPSALKKSATYWVVLFLASSKS